jgi:hypothetical protein
MKIEMFYQKFANTPLSDRFSVIDFNEGGMKTLNDIYQQLKKYDEAIRPFLLKQERLLKLADKYYIFKTAKIKK